MNPNHNCICCQSEQAEKIEITFTDTNMFGGILKNTTYLCKRHKMQWDLGLISESDMLYCVQNRNANNYKVFIK